MGTDGPGREGLKKHLGLMTQMIRNVKVERKHMFLCGDRVVVLSHMTGEIGDVPAGFDEFPCFPGINPDKIRGNYTFLHNISNYNHILTCINIFRKIL